MNTTLEENPVVEEKFVFNGLTRCDACGGSSQAYVRCTKNGKDLLWCGHHFNKFMSEMVTQGWHIDNQLSILADEIEAFKSKAKDSDF